jgi:hypothetical protein
MDQENTTSGSYPLVDIDPPSSSEAKTIVVRRGQDHPAMRRLEAAGLVAAQGAHPTPMPMPSPLQRTMPEGYVPSSGPAPTSAPVPPSGPMPISTQVPSGPMPGQMASGEMAPMGVYPLDSEPPPPTEPMHARRSGARIFLALLLGAIGLMLVGFFTVALVLHLLQ